MPTSSQLAYGKRYKSMRALINAVVPAVLKKKIRSLQCIDRIYAKEAALTSKRVDICAAQFAHNLHLSNHPPISGKVCLEIGSGRVLSHAIVCHLLGAKKVLATDLFPLAYPQYLRAAIHKSIASIPRDILSPFSEHSQIRKRFDNLLSVHHFDFDVLNKLGIEYISPIDIAKDRLNIAVDFIYSYSVLEHVPCEDVPLLLNNILADLNPGGTMIHSVHLEDHRDIKNEPFGFLAIPSNDYPASLQTARGNRIRKSRWQEIFSAIENTDSELIYVWTRKDKELPAHIDPSIDYKNKSDLQVSHIGIHTRKHK